MDILVTTEVKEKEPTTLVSSNLDWMNNNDDINIIIQDKNPIFGDYGFAYITREDGPYKAFMYQSRINMEYEDDEEIVEELGDGKAYVYTDKHRITSKGLLACINKVLAFWFITGIKVIPNIKNYASIKEAIEAEPDAQVIIYQTK